MNNTPPTNPTPPAPAQEAVPDNISPIIPGKVAEEQPQNNPINVQLGFLPGAVTFNFSPPAVRMILEPTQAIDWAISVLQAARAAQQPPQSIIQGINPGEPSPIIPAR